MSATKRQYRKKPVSDSEEGDGLNGVESQTGGVDTELLQEAIELRKYRRRQHGLDAEDLLKGGSRKTPEVEAKPAEAEPKTMLETGTISAGFKTQTKAMDADRHMNEFVEKELAKRRGVGPASGNDAENPSAVSDVLYEIPDHLKVASQPVVEGNVTFSASMLTAIPEVDLGIDAKLKNIEDTEKAKRKMMEERAKRKTGETDLIGSNVVAADRWLQNPNRPRGDYDPLTGKDVGAGRGQNDRRDRATDDLVMERFKKRQKRGR